MNDYAFGPELDALLAKHGLVATRRDVHQRRRGLTTASDRWIIYVEARELAK